MPDGDLRVVCRERRSRARRGVAVYEHDVGLGLAQNALHPIEDARRDLGDRLIVAHHVEIVVGRDRKQREQIVEHLAVLRGHADDRRHPRPRRRKRAHDRCHLNRVRPRAEHRHHA